MQQESSKKQRDISIIWTKLFPLKIGDRVKIIKTSQYPNWKHRDNELYDKNPFIGKYGTIDWIDGEQKEAFVALDHAVAGTFSEVHVCIEDIRLVKPRRKQK